MHRNDRVKSAINRLTKLILLNNTYPKKKIKRVYTNIFLQTCLICTCGEFTAFYQ